MTIFLRVAALTFALIIIFVGCAYQPQNAANNNNPINAATPAPQSSPQTVKTSATDESDVPVTLPVLDAFFADQSFASELKAKLGLTDDEVEALRKVAHEETQTLRETNTDNYAGTTSAARTLASERIKSIIGDEKTERLKEFLRQRWSGADENGAGETDAHATSAKFNVVPTDTRVIVNTPAYRMDVFENGRLMKSYKIGIGYPEFPLPTGKRKAADIIFNPTWTPPDEPWVENSNKVKPGEKVEAGSKLNPLGPIKIPIGLPSLIHGGKSQAVLGGFASHGCVGLTTPQVEDFALLLAEMSGTELTDQQIADYAKNPKETKDVKLSHPVTVELRYETIVVEDGRLHIYRDVYDHGTNTEENLRTVLSSYGVTLEQLSDEERSQVLNALREMSRDAAGKSDETKMNANSNTAQAKDRSAGNNTNRQGDAGKVTRSIKGKKEIVIEIAALKGKGYPAPVDLDTGSGSKKTNISTGRQRKA
ncbi:MAG TPA: L,D-transpeptidase family protein [Pyrinomonadaceae bacterium]|nr:L,D-transpeptidase family protein [Pyrinomonadaceae bacterium]